MLAIGYAFGHRDIRTLDPTYVERAPVRRMAGE
jgi:hypothetical protein